MTNLIRTRLPMLAVGFALSGAIVSTSAAALHGRHVPDVVSKLRSMGRLPGTNVLHLSIGLPVHNQAQMNQLVLDMYDPTSPSYHKFLSPEKFAVMFGPTEEDYQAVVNYAEKNGLKVEGTHPNRMLLDVVGRAGDVEKAFGVTLKVYQHPTEARKFYSPDTEPSVPDTLPILDVTGLDNYRRPHPHFHIKSETVPTNGVTAHTSGVSPNAGTGFGGGYMGDDFRHAYVPGTSLNGSGQAVALVQFDGYFASDIALYASMAGRTNIPLANILLDGFDGIPTFLGNDLEVCLDIEMVMSMAPALTQIRVYEGNPFNFHPNDVLNRIATDNAAHQVSCSWGWTGGPNGTTEQIFVQMALQGQTFLTSSGDDDAYLPGAVDNPGNFGTPANSPNITVVGGTTLTMAGSGVAYASEQVWNWGGGTGSAGGYSSFYTIPSWQTNINMTAVGGSQTGRNFPDIAMTADQVFVVSDGGFLYPDIGGTSCAAPLWAGFMALVNQQAAANAKVAVGFINPAIYALALTPGYNTYFHDTTVGNNTKPTSPASFFAAINYDLCTGLGTPNGTNLIIALAGSINPITHIPPPNPPYGTTLSALNGADPNGKWSLFVVDSQGVDSGAISNGWVLTLTSANLVGQSADVGIGMTVSTNLVAVGGNITFYVTVTNYGSSTASNVSVADSLPFNADYISNSVSMGTATLSAQELDWDLGTLLNGQGGVMAITLQASSAGDITDSAVVNTATPDNNPDDNSASVTASSIIVITQQVQLLGAYVGGGSGGFNISGTNTLGVPLIIQASTNLVTWTGIFTNTPPPSDFNFVDHDATNYPMRFYRSVTGP